MASGFSVRALGKGSVASFMQAALGVAWIILWILAVVLIVGAIAYFVALGMIGAGVLDQSILAPGDGSTRVQVPGLVLDNPAGAIWQVVVPGLLIGGVAIGGGLVIVGRLKRLFDNFTSGEPFRRENAGHLRAIWITMLVIEVSRYALLALTGVLLAAFGPDDIQSTITLNVDISTWASILILIVLAEVFREGARLKEEQELTI
jgi:hypothetical protein